MHNEFENGRSVLGWLHTADVEKFGEGRNFKQTSSIVSMSL